VTLADGRVRRGERNREAIIDALLACYHDGNPAPSIPEVAARAGVSVRSVHNHFDDVEALRAEVAQRQVDRFAHLTAPPPAGAPLATRIAAVVDARAALFEAVTPVRRAALLSVHESPTIAANLAKADRGLRRSLERAFAPEFHDASADTLEALDALLSWDTWNRLRAAQGCSAARAKRVLVASATALLGDRKGDVP
jgi:TetR/AcrR family transcriptional regulator of autoinduction and epiphytic fitness